MINPEKITNYNLEANELEEVILFWVCAAGKNGTTMSRLLNKLLTTIGAFEFSSIFNTLKTYSVWELAIELREHGIGCYNQKARTIIELVNADLDLQTCTAEDLEQIYGIGMKTSRCFILHSRKDAAYAGIDTHMLKHLRERGVDNVPKTTPSSKKQYKRLELEVLRLSKEAGISPADYDLQIWNTYAVK